MGLCLTVTQFSKLQGSGYLYKDRQAVVIKLEVNQGLDSWAVDIKRKSKWCTIDFKLEL